MHNVLQLCICCRFREPFSVSRNKLNKRAKPLKVSAFSAIIHRCCYKLATLIFSKFKYLFSNSLIHLSLQIFFVTLTKFSNVNGLKYDSVFSLNVSIYFSMPISGSSISSIRSRPTCASHCLKGSAFGDGMLCINRNNACRYGIV